MSDETVFRRRLSAEIEQRCRTLGIPCECPYVARDDDVEYAAFIPHFGSRSGILIDVTCGPDFASNLRRHTTAKNLGIGISFVNPDFLEDGQEFIEALREWGFYGDVADLAEETKRLLL
jgi:hypothetical protein